MGLFITEVRTVALASLIIAGSGGVGCSDSPTVSVSAAPGATVSVTASESVGAADTPTLTTPIFLESVDYRNFTETDPDGTVAVAESVITLTEYDRGTSTYVRYDLGEGGVGTQFTHYTSATFDSTPDQGAEHKGV